MDSLHFHLYEAQDICLAPFDHEKDAEILVRWSHNSTFQRQLRGDLHPLQSAPRAKKWLKELEDEIDKHSNGFLFAIRQRSDDNLIGLAEIPWVSWNAGAAVLRMGIGEVDQRKRGYGSQALHLLLRFAFHELNLYRLSVRVGGDNPAALRFFLRHGFSEEVRRRQALQRDGRIVDEIILGLLHSEWLALHIPPRRDYGA